MNNSPNLINHFKLPEVKVTQETPKRSRKWLIIGCITGLVLLITAGIFAYLFFKTKEEVIVHSTQQVEQKPAEKTTKEINAELISEVGKLIVLPKDEEPSIATVSDLSKLQGQPFFAKAQIGDKVLVYNKEKKAILYRPSEKKIIELAPLITSTPETPPSTGQTPAPAQ